MHLDANIYSPRTRSRPANSFLKFPFLSCRLGNENHPYTDTYPQRHTSTHTETAGITESQMEMTQVTIG